MRCPGLLLRGTSWPAFIRSYHHWKHHDRYPTDGELDSQSHTWVQAVQLFDGWVEDVMKIIREAEAKKAEALAKAKASKGRGR